MKAVFFAVMLCCVPVASTAQIHESTVLSPSDARSFVKLGDQKRSNQKKRVATMSEADVIAAIRQNLTGTTKIIYQKHFGVYVEYTAPDGSDRMWSPGNSSIVKGIWGIRTTFSDEIPRACFRYFNTKHISTGDFYADECVDTAGTLTNSDAISVVSGDIFNLMSDQVPYVKGEMEVPALPSTEPNAAAQ